jgi:hypothetical protein
MIPLYILLSHALFIPTYEQGSDVQPAALEPVLFKRPANIDKCG